MNGKKSTVNTNKRSRVKERDIKPTKENIEKLRNDIVDFREFGKHMITILSTWTTIYLAILNIPIIILRESINFSSINGIVFAVFAIITVAVLLVSIGFFIYVFLPIITSYDEDVKIQLDHYKKQDRDKREMLIDGTRIYLVGYALTLLSIILLVILII